MNKTNTLVLCCALLSGCTATYKQYTLTEPGVKLIKGKSVVIAIPDNGFYEDEEYKASGKMTAFAVRAAFARFSNSATVVPDCKDVVCLNSTHPESFYLVIPEILHWEDRATEWSGISDKIEVKVSVYERQNLKGVSSIVISGKSKWASFGGDHPQDLLPDPLSSYVESLY